MQSLAEPLQPTRAAEPFAQRTGFRPAAYRQDVRLHQIGLAIWI